MEKQELKIEDLKAGEELVCIDRDGYINEYPVHERVLGTRGKILSQPIIIKELYLDNIMLTNKAYRIPKNALRFFAKKSEGAKVIAVS